MSASVWFFAVIITALGFFLVEDIKPKLIPERWSDAFGQGDVHCFSGKNYYEILGLKRAQATQGDVTKAYRSLTKVYHPDVNKRPTANKEFMALREAYEMLSDPASRKEYDEKMEAEGALTG
eukprot:jgi/Mesvir1/272/Mv13608-RA.1